MIVWYSCAETEWTGEHIDMLVILTRTGTPGKDPEIRVFPRQVKTTT